MADRLTGADVYRLARAAGLTEQEASVATSLAYAESGYDPRAHGVGPRDDSYGLWQINLHPTVGNRQTLMRQYGITSAEQLYDPTVNARAMVTIYRARGWEKPWAGSWRKVQGWSFDDWQNAGVPLNDAGASGDPKNVSGAPLAPPISDQVSAITDLIPAVGRILAWILNPTNWRRIGIAVLGIALVALAVVIAGRGLLAGGPVGAAVKVATAAGK